jgi:hypothetical protein
MRDASPSGERERVSSLQSKGNSPLQRRVRVCDGHNSKAPLANDFDSKAVLHFMYSFYCVICFFVCYYFVHPRNGVADACKERKASGWGKSMPVLPKQQRSHNGTKMKYGATTLREIYGQPEVWSRCLQALDRLDLGALVDGKDPRSHE